MSDNAGQPLLSVVIPTLGRDLLIRTVESLIAAKGFDRIEIIVAGRIAPGPVLDRLAELARAHPAIRHLPVAYPAGDSSEKKNAGWREAHSELVAFLDDDVVVAPDWPERMIRCFDRPEVGLVSGPGLVPDDVSLMTRLAGLALSSRGAGYVSERYLKGQDPVRPIRWSRIIGCNMVYRRSVIEGLGGFDPVYWPGEEMIASFRAEQKGHAILFNSDAYVYHYPRQSIRRFWKQIYGYGATRVRLIRGGTDVEPTTVVPAAWVLSLAVLGIGSLFTPWCLALLALDLFLYALAALWITFDKVRETGRPRDGLLFFLIPVMHLSYGIAEWHELFRPNKDLSETSPER